MAAPKSQPGSATCWGLLPSTDPPLSSRQLPAQPGIHREALNNAEELSSFLPADNLLENISELGPPQGKHSQTPGKKLLSLEEPHTHHSLVETSPR